MWERFAFKKWHGSSGFWKKQSKTPESRADGSWQEESLHKEEVDILRDVRSLSMDGSIMRKAFHGGHVRELGRVLEER